MRSTFLGLLAVFHAGTANATATCYDAKGNTLDSTHSDFIPCPDSGLSTICCGLNRPNPAGGDQSNGFTKDECLPNGLCQNRIVQNGTMDTTFWLDFCTDPNIAGGNCLNVCGASRGQFGNTQMTPCTGQADSDRWCCGTDKSCCTTGISVITLPQKFVASGIVSSSMVSPTASSSTSASASTSSPSGSLVTGTPLSSSSKSGISGGAIAGIVIGVIIALLLIGAVAFFAMRAQKYKKEAAANSAPAYVEAPADSYQEAGAGYPAREKHGHQVQRAGLAHGVPPAEMAQPPSELPGEDLGALPVKK